MRCIVPELKSNVDSHTPKSRVAIHTVNCVTVWGTETYLSGFVGATMSSTIPAISVMAARTAAVQRGVGRYLTLAISALTSAPAPAGPARRGG